MEHKSLAVREKIEQRSDRRFPFVSLSGEMSVYSPRLTPEQSGLYTCVAENSIGKVNRSIYLDVQCKCVRGWEKGN